MTDRYTPEEIQDIADNYANALKSGIEPTAEMTREMKDATVGIKGYTTAMESAKKQFVSTLSKTAGELGSAMYKGTKGAGVLGDAAENAGTALELMITMIPGIGFAAKAAAFAIGAFGKAVNMAAKQGDALYKSYQELGKSGMGAAGGITDVFNNMQKLGYGIGELDSAVKLLTNNSTELATFSGTAASGAQAFADSMKGITHGPFLEEMMNLGKTVDDLNSAGASYVKQQVLMGRSQRDITGTQTERTQAYIRSLDTLQRLTGKSAEALEKEQEAALDDDAYNIYMERLEQSGKAGQEQAQKIKESLALLPESMQKLARAGLGGNVGAQGELMNVMPNFIKDLRDQNMSRDQTIANANKDLKTFKDTFGDNYLLAADSMEGFGVKVKDLNKGIAQTGNLTEREAYAAKEKEMHDGATKNLTETQIAQMNSRDSLQSLVQLGVAPATSALSNLADVVADLTSLLPGGQSRPGKGLSAPAPELGAHGTGTRGGRLAATGAGAAAGATIGATVGSAIPIPIVGTAIGGALGGLAGGIAGYLGYTNFGGALDKPDNYLKFTGESGSEANFQQLDPNVQRQLMAAGKAYSEMSGGKKLIINSAKRTTEKQAQLYNDWIANGKRGNPVAPPGRSAHESGLAVDIEQGKNDNNAISALNQAGLYQTVPNDPVHFQPKNAPPEAAMEYGGIVRARPGGTNILAGEAGDDEAFVPLRGGKIPVDIKNSDFIKEFTRNILSNVGLDQQQRSGITAREGVENLRLLLPEFSRAIAGGIGDIKSTQLAPDRVAAPKMDDFSNQMAGVMTNMKSMIDNFVKTKSPNPGDFAGSSMMPNFTKALPETDTATMLSDRTDKLTQQLAKLENLPIANAQSTDNSPQLALMSQQLNKLDELVRVMNSQLNVSGKILAYQH